MRFDLNLGDGSGNVGLVQASSDATFSYAPPLNLWTHITVVATSTGTALYVNGIFQQQVGAFTLGTDAGAAVTLGTSQNGQDDPFSGGLDEIRIYNRALGATEIAKLYGSGAVKVGASSVDLQRGSTLVNGLVGHWSFDGPDLTDKVYDRSGQNNNGYFYDGATSSAKAQGKLGQALQFDGTDDYVLTANTLNVTPATACAWVKYNDAPTGNYMILQLNGAGTGFRFYIGNNSGNNDDVNMYNNTGAASSASDSVRSGVWNHVCGAVDASNNGSVYINGALAAGPSPLGSPGAANGRASIGAEQGAGNPLSGLIDDARFYSRVLSAAEVQQLYKLGAATIGR